MSFQTFGADAPGEESCHYGASKLQCRGPARQFDAPYMVAMGDSETFGKFVKYPFASLLEKSIGIPCVNLGSPNSGLDALLQDPDLIRIAKSADLAIIQAMGAQNLTNRFSGYIPGAMTGSSNRLRCCSTCSPRWISPILPLPTT